MYVSKYTVAVKQILNFTRHKKRSPKYAVNDAVPNSTYRHDYSSTSLKTYYIHIHFTYTDHCLFSS